MNSKEKIIVGVDSGDYETSIYWVKKERHEVIKHEPLELIEWFEKHTNMNLVFAVETIENVFIKSAISEGFSVFATTPFQSKNMRGVDSISGKKDDRYDAKVHGEFYRDRPDVFRKISKEDDIIESLKALVSWRLRLQKEKTRLENQIRSLLKTTFAGLHYMQLGFDTHWALKLIIEAPIAERFSDFNDSKIIARLAKKLKVSPQEVHQKLVPQKLRATMKEKCIGEELTFLAQSALEIVRKMYECKKNMERFQKMLSSKLADEFDLPKNTPTAIELLRSFSNMGVTSVAVLISQYPEILTGPNRETLLAYSGAVPVTKASGKSKGVAMRRARNIVLQNMLTQLALGNIKGDSKWRALYKRHRVRGKSHYHALRLMFRPIINTLCAMLRDRTLYEEGKC